MSNVALPGLAVLNAKPTATDASSAKSNKPPTGPTFGAALNKAVESKPVESKTAQPSAITPITPTTANVTQDELKPVLDNDLPVADLTAVIDNTAAPESTHAGAPAAKLNVEDDVPLSDSLATSVELPTAQVDQVAVLPPVPPVPPVTIDPSVIPGLTRSADNVKDFTPAENVAGSAVMAAIKLSKTMEQRGVSQVSLPVAAPKDIQSLASATKTVDTPLDADLLPAGTAQALEAQSTEHSEHQSQGSFIGSAPTSDKTSVALPAPAVTPMPAAQDTKMQPAPTVDANSFTPTAAPAIGSANSAPGNTPNVSLQAPVASQAWNQGLGQQLVNMHMRGDESVDLHLHPADLGPISINLRVTDSSQAQVQFFSHNANVRSAIEQALPQLKEVMAQQGIALGQTSVGDQRQQQSSRDDAPRAINTRELGEKLNLVAADEVKPQKIQSVDRQISTYA